MNGGSGICGEVYGEARWARPRRRECSFEVEAGGEGGGNKVRTA